MSTLTAPPPTIETPSAPVSDRMKRGGSGLFGFGTLVGAFLLFQLELIVAKSILPWFGGSPAVWTTCMLFFQLTLLCGYAFAHWSATRLSPRRQSSLQLGVIALAIVSFAVAVVAWGSPLTPGVVLRDAIREHPIAHIFVVLSVCVGLPFFLLSTTGPLLQHWFRAQGQGESVYRLYALSNLGSLFGLISYPFLLEWSLTLHHQAWLWNALFLLYVPVYAILCRRAGQRYSGDEVAEAKPSAVSTRSRMLWIALAACGSAMLLATTNLLCEDVVVTPTLWVLPLCLYLLSFILCFDHPRWYRREIFYPLYAGAIGVALWIFNSGISVDLIRRTDAYLLILFVVCMVCHGELARSKPAASELTSFYLMVSLGGVLGGVLVTIVAPRIFSGYWEYHIALILCGALALWAQLADRTAPLATHASLKAVAIAGALIVAGGAVYQSTRAQTTGRLRLRNFFGVKQVFEKDGMRYLRNGGVDHGGQYLDPARRYEGTFYYTKHTAVGTLLTNYPNPEGRGRRIGILGLGTGVLAVYGQPQDTMRFLGNRSAGDRAGKRYRREIFVSSRYEGDIRGDRSGRPTRAGAGQGACVRRIGRGRFRGRCDSDSYCDARGVRTLHEAAERAELGSCFSHQQSRAGFDVGDAGIQPNGECAGAVLYELQLGVGGVFAKSGDVGSGGAGSARVSVGASAERDLDG